LAAGVADVGKVIITHDHADHCHGIDDLRQVAQNIGGQVPLYARRHVLERIRSRFAYLFQDVGIYRAVADPVPIDGEIRLGKAKLSFVDQPHGGITSLGIRVEEDARSLGYAIDFHDFTPEMGALYEGVDIWICDCLRRTPHPTHAHLGAVLAWAREMNVGQLLLTHLDKSMDYATLVAELPDWAAPAYDGQEVVL
jgi:phosphoribosyl 1,2-cyclic phosphate phosphodiesterase